MIMNVPTSIAPAPSPAMLLPAINAAEEGASPQRREPISKMVSPARNTHFAGYMIYSLPQTNCAAASTNRKELPYQATSFIVWKSSVIRGTAVARIV